MHAVATATNDSVVSRTFLLLLFLFFAVEEKQARPLKIMP